MYRKETYHITKARDIQEIPSKLQPTESAAERLAGMLENLVKQTKSNRLPRRPTKKRPVSGHGHPEIVQKRCKNKGFSENSLRSKSNGAICPGTTLDPLSFSNRPQPGPPQSAHAQNHWKSKGKRMFARRRPKIRLMYSRLQ